MVITTIIVDYSDSNRKDINALVKNLDFVNFVHIVMYSIVAAGRSPAEIVGSNPTGGMDICLL